MSSDGAWHVNLGRFDYANALLNHALDGNSETLNPFQTAGNTSNTAAAANVAYGANNNGAANSFTPMRSTAFVLAQRSLSSSDTSAFISSLANAKATSQATAPYIYYVFRSGGLSSPLEQLFGLQSSDALNWSNFGVAYTPNSGKVVRDPSVTTISGTYWLAHTDATSGNEFGPITEFAVASSSDGVVFTYQTAVDCTTVVGNTTNSRVWAPEWFVDDDGSVHVFFAGSSDATNFAIDETHPTNGAYTNWSTPVQVTGTGFPATMIDPFVVSPANSPNGKYTLWYSHSTGGGATEYLEYAPSTSLTSGYTVAKSGDWAGWGTAYEGESLVKLPSGNWRLWLDNEGNGVYYSDSSDNCTTWTTKKLISAPFTPQHGTVLKQ